MMVCGSVSFIPFITTKVSEWVSVRALKMDKPQMQKFASCSHSFLYLLSIQYQYEHQRKMFKEPDGHNLLGISSANCSAAHASSLNNLQTQTSLQYASALKRLKMSWTGHYQPVKWWVPFFSSSTTWMWMKGSTAELENLLTTMV